MNGVEVMKKYKSFIEKVLVEGATFKNSTANSFEPTWINYFYGNNGTGKSTIARSIKALDGLTWNGNGGKSASDYGSCPNHVEYAIII